MPTPDLTGRVVLLTGAAGGFGCVLARAFLDAGASVACYDVDRGRLDELAHTLNEAYDSARFYTGMCDISRYADCESAVGETQDSLEGLHVLVNNAAMGMGAIRADHMQRLVSIDEISPHLWQRFVAVNLSGGWHMTKAAIGALRDQGFGRIINVTTSFFTMLRGGFHPYGPAKAGLEAMSAGHAAEFAGSGVTVNVVVPGGPSDTPMIPEQAPYARDELVPPSAMAPPMLWLASDEAGDVNGMRFVAARWDPALAPAEAAAACGAPIGWPELAADPVWPGGRPSC